MNPATRVSVLITGALLLAGCSVAAPAPSSSAAASMPAIAPPVAAEQPSRAPASIASSASPALDAELTADQFVDLVMNARLTSYATAMDLSMDYQGTPMQMTLLGEVADAETTTMRLNMTAMGMAIELTVVREEYFMKMALLGEGWFKMSEADARSTTQGMQTAGMKDWVEKARKYLERVELIGRDEIDGAPAVHYRLTFDARALDEMGASSSELAAEDFLFDAWLDDKGRTVQYGMELEETKSGVPIVMEGTMSRFGEEFEIEAPKNYTELS